MTVAGEPLGFDADGTARWLVKVRFMTAQGRKTRLLRGGDLRYIAWHAHAQWQTRARFGAPAAIVSTVADGPLAVRVHASGLGKLADARTQTDTRTWSGVRGAVKALGPHLVFVGWFPVTRRAPVRIVRSGGGRPMVVSIKPPASTYGDASVQPGATYRYTVLRPGAGAAQFLVHVPAEPARPALVAPAGKGMWLSFSPSELDPDSYEHLEPDAIVEQAVRAGLRYIELRTAYGEYWEITPAAKPTIDRLIDDAAVHGIAVIGCTVPRQSSFEDLRQSVNTALYRTSTGTPLAGLGLDLERGDEYLGTGASGYAALAKFPRLVRQALGPGVPIVGIVEDPYLERLGNRDVPYSAIAASSSVLQPMTYWQMLNRGAMSVGRTRRTVIASLERLRRLASRDIPFNVGGQTAALAGKPAPTPEEVSTAMDVTRRSGAIGIAFFEWKGTDPGQWSAIAGYRW
ncbi:MAG: hypothetical protein JO060_04155 [Candidatus Eremiobacteraeota bacterium]|nr:hypothetical protein [Candidatus Eremiobacteraeota bacterium]